MIKTWPLFFGLGVLMIGNGLQGTLLGVRAGLEGFSYLETGFVMSLYFVGYLIGSLKVPHFIAAVGHIRVFAALASLASVTILIHGVFVDPITWYAVRVISGFSFAGLYLVVESWLNDAATNKTRGTIMGAYMVVTYLGMTIGQFLLNIADPKDIELFVMTSVLVSIALLPISLSKRPAPDFTVAENISFLTIWRRSPLGILGVIMIGVTSAAIFGIGPVYAQQIGLSNAGISTFMAAFLIGAVAFQMPLAYISDHMDRRKMIIILGFSSAFMAFLLMAMAGYAQWITFMIMAGLGGACLPIYGQCISHVNDHLLPRQFVASTGALLLLNGTGAAFGPLVATAMMQFTGVQGFVITLILSLGSIGLFGIYRSFRSDAVPMDDQGDTILMPARGSSVSIYTEDS